MRHPVRSMLIAALSLTATALALPPSASVAHAAIAGVQPGLGNARERFQQTFPGGSLIDSNGQLRRVFGRQFSSGASPHDSAESFLRQWSTLWVCPSSSWSRSGRSRMARTRSG